MDTNTASFIEKRIVPRFQLPRGTTALFKKGDGSLATVYTRNISESGMLICDIFPVKRYRLDSIIKDIFINIPDDQIDEASRSNDKTSLFIDQGQIVRYFLDEIPHTTCYGISFMDENTSIKKRINNLVNNFPES